MHAALTLLACAAMGPGPDGPPDRLYTPASAVGPALAFVARLPPEKRKYARFLSNYNQPRPRLPRYGRVSSLAVNGLSRNPVVLPLPAVPGSAGRLLYVDLDYYKIPPKAWDRLGELGSGRAPFPEPWFHLLVRGRKDVVREVTETEYLDAYYRPLPSREGAVYYRERKKKVLSASGLDDRVLAQPPWLPRKELLDLVELTHSEFPIYRADWFVYYSQLEPRYHELLGLGDDLADYFELARVDPRRVDRAGSRRRGVVQNSEVAPHPRALDRYSSDGNDGDGYLWSSLDYDEAIAAGDLLNDLLGDRPRAREVILALPNGLHAFGVFNNQNKRLDRAGIEFAADRRNGFASVEVEIRNCPCCHNAGMIRVADVVRLESGDLLALAVRRLKEKDPERAQAVIDRFFARDLNALVARDQRNYAAAVKAATGLAAEAAGLELREVLLEYERGLTVEALACETGYPREVVLGVLERSKLTGLDHSALRAVRKGVAVRRDQFEAKGMGQLMQLLMAVPRIPQPPPPAREKGDRVTREKGGE